MVNFRPEIETEGKLLGPEKVSSVVMSAGGGGVFLWNLCDESV